MRFVPLACATILLIASGSALAAPREPSGTSIDEASNHESPAPGRQGLQSLDQAASPIPENIQVSYDGLTAGASRLVTDFSEVHLAVSPVDPDHLLGSSKFFHTPETYGFFTGVFESFDGGLSWSQEQPVGLETYSLTSDPVNAFDHEGNGYFTLLTRNPTGLDMLKKAPGGDWELPVIVDRTTTTDKQWIAGDMDMAGLSPHAGNLYMSWTAIGGPSRVVFSRSTDGNRSWSTPPLELDRGNVQGSIVAVGHDGTVYVIYGDQIFGDAAAGAIKWVRSSDGGASFTQPAMVADSVSVPFQLPNSLFRTPASLPAFAASPIAPNLYVTWADYRRGDADILLARSSDGGNSWDQPVRLNDDPIGNDVDQFQPQVSVAPDGRVAVAWLDRRLDCPDLAWVPRSHVGRENYCIDTYMTRSFDQGRSWQANQRVSAQTWDPTVNLPMVNATTGFIGDYIGLVGSRDFDYPFFPSTADLGDNPRNRQQVFVARVPAVDPPVDLVPSRITAAPSAVEPGETLTVTIHIENRGPSDASAVAMTHTLPAELTYVPDSLVVVGDADSVVHAAGQIRWRGGVPSGGEARIRFQARADSAAEDGTALRLEARLHDDQDRQYLRRTQAAISLAPRLVFATPADGIEEVGPTTTVILRFSEAMDPESLVVSSAPALPEGFWQPAWAPNRQSVSLRHAEPFSMGRRYTLGITAHDALGTPLRAGDVANPWSFTTEGGALLLPWLAREAGRAP